MSHPPFRDRLLRTLRLVQEVLDLPGVLVVGSQVPNLLEPAAASTLVVSKDVDLGVSVAHHAAVKHVVRGLTGIHPSADEPSVWIPDDSALLEVNFVGIDPAIEDAAESYVLDDPQLPLVVFGPLSLLREGRRLELGELRVPLPRLSGLALEKLLTERTGGKGERDLLVAAALLSLASPAEEAELIERYRRLADELRHALCSNLTLLSLLDPHPGMLDPRPLRGRVAWLLAELEAGEEEGA